VLAVLRTRGHQAGAAQDSFHPWSSPKEHLGNTNSHNFEAERWPFHGGVLSAGGLRRERARSTAAPHHFISPSAVERGGGREASAYLLN